MKDPDTKVWCEEEITSEWLNTPDGTLVLAVDRLSRLSGKLSYRLRIEFGKPGSGDVTSIEVPITSGQLEDLAKVLLEGADMAWQTEAWVDPDGTNTCVHNIRLDQQCSLCESKSNQK